MNSAHCQSEYEVRFDWGLAGALAVAGEVDVAVVVDVLSFTTTLSVAVDLGTVVLPYRWNDESARDFARQHDAVLAVGRSRAGFGQVSLSPASWRSCPVPPARLVLPSPNGSTIAHHLAASSVVCLGACLRNATAVASWIGDRRPRGAKTVAVIAAGERWPGGELRPAAEDAWGAGAVIAQLAAHGWSGLSPEAELARAAYESVQGRERELLLDCASGRELVEQGYRADVEIAAEVGSSYSVSLLENQRFVRASSS